jgi:hypothetical protein
MQFSIKKLLWIDASAAFLATSILFMFKTQLSPLFSLPENILTAQLIIAFCYGCFSFYLAKSTAPTQIMLNTLVIGNAIYALICLFLLAFFYNTATVFGIAYLLFDAVIVAFLATIEWRFFKKNHA